MALLTPQTTNSGAKLSRRECFDFELLYLLEIEPAISQRQMAARLDVSLGLVNRRLRALAERGLAQPANVPSRRFCRTYGYALTPLGAAQRVGLTRCMLTDKITRCERLIEQIDKLQQDVADNPARIARGTAG